MLLGASTAWRTDAALLARGRAGDRRAMEEVYGKHGPRLYALAMRLLGRADDAEDVVQETLLRAWRGAGEFRGEAALGTWLCRIALNEARALRRRRRPEGPLPEGLAATEAPRDVPTARRLEAALRALPEGYREVIVMHDVLGFEHAEIAEILEVQIGTSKSQLHKARARMREML